MRRAFLAGLAFAQLVAAAQAVPPGTFHADGPRGRKALALTFDDGPGEYTRQVLDILDQNQVKATFFVNGDQVELRPALAREIVARGHELADHTYSHMNFYAYEKKHGAEQAKLKIQDEIRKSKAAIEKAAGLSPALCRMPHGFHRVWMKDLAKPFGYALINWTFGEDWLAVPEEKMAQDYLAQVKPGAILLFHDGGKNRKKTVAILPKVIEKARKDQLELVKVSELIGE